MESNTDTQEAVHTVLKETGDQIIDICIEAVDKFYDAGKPALIELLKKLKQTT